MMVSTPVLFIALPLLLAFLSPLWEKMRILSLLLFATQAVLFALAVSFYPAVQSAPILETIVIAPPLGIHLHLDMASWLFVTLFTFAASITTFYLLVSKPEPYLQGRKFFILMQLLIAGCSGMVLTGDVFNLYVFLEIAGISAYALSAIKQDKPALEAGIKYLIIGSVAALFFLFGIVLVYLQTGTLNLAAIAMKFETIPSTMQILIGLLLLVGLGIKTELFPFNFWVPDIYQGSDPAITSLFSGIVVKAFLFVLFHLYFVLHADPHTQQMLLMTLGALTMIVAEWIALRQEDIKRMLAYSSLGQVGLVVMALGFAHESVSGGAMFHLVNHTLFKLLLFLVAAMLILRAAGAKLESLRGMGYRFPLAGALFVFGSLAVLGLPPLSGFISKFWILKGFAEAQTFWPIALILIAALLEAAYYFRWIKVFYTRSEKTVEGQIPALAYLPLLVLAAIILYLGIQPGSLETLFIQSGETLMNRNLYLESVL